MEDSRGSFSHGGGGGGRKKVLENEEFQEDEVWAMVQATEGSNSNSKSRKKSIHGCSSSSSLSSLSSAWRVNATPISIPRATANGGGEEISATKQVARRHSSAPVGIPDRSKISKKRSKKKFWDDACDAHDDDDDDDHGKVDDDDDDDNDEMAPPHEYLARRLASTRIASHSMCEGVGRTLKGRDLSKLRNAILTKTGFIE